MWLKYANLKRSRSDVINFLLIFIPLIKRKIGGNIYKCAYLCEYILIFKKNWWRFQINPWQKMKTFPLFRAYIWKIEDLKYSHSAYLFLRQKYLSSFIFACLTFDIIKSSYFCSQFHFSLLLIGIINFKWVFGP